MPTYRLSCENCGKEWDRSCTISKRNEPCDDCGSEVVQVYVPNGFMTFQDDIPGGMMIENLGPVPVKIYSHTERKNIMKQRKLVEMVRHTGVPGSDRSPHTISWEVAPLSDARPICMLSVEERIVRRQEAAERLGITVEELRAVSGDIDDLIPILAETEEEERTGGEFAKNVIRPFNMTGQGEDVKDIIEIIEQLEVEGGK